MYYSSGNYEAFARPQKPKDVDKKRAWIIGSGLAGLSTAAFLIRDGQMKGENIHILEEMDIEGGACDGIYDITRGYVIRGGREMEDHFECLWDLYRSIPTLEDPSVSVLDKFYWLNKEDPNYSLMRATENRGQDAKTNGEFGLSQKASESIVKLFLTPEDKLYDLKITDVMDSEFFESNFWLYWRTMFAFEEWHSALEMKRYLQRFVHHIGGLPDFKALKFTRYNQYESLILPLVQYLKEHGVNFVYDVQVKDVDFTFHEEEIIASSITWVHGENESTKSLTEDDLIFITNGSCTENSSLGDQYTPASFITDPVGGCWELWRNIRKKDSSFGNPDKYCTQTDLTNWESATVTTLDEKIPKYIEKICKREVKSGKVVTGGIITVKDSSWLMSYTFNRQPHFKNQNPNECVGWIYGLFTNVPGDFIKKPMKDCNGIEICAEWLYHMGVPEDEIMDLAENSANTVPCMMPYITSFFMPRKKEDRPKVVPDKAKNFAFIGQFAETERDTIFTTEYSVRTGMEAAYTLLNIDRGVPEVWGSKYDVRALLDATHQMLDGKKLEELDLSLKEKRVAHKIQEKIKGTEIEELLKEYQLI
ncbi:MAG: oleate hydratase [Tissierellia bacterium]|nr:oleate hydratase [Tissierellia bacterium]